MRQLTPAQALQFAAEHLLAGRVREAENVYRQILQQRPSSPDALHGLGLVAYQTGRLPLAIDLLGQAVAKAPAIAYFHNNLGLALQDAGQHERAIACYRSAIAVDPSFADAYFNLGNVYLGQREVHQAVECYRRHLSLRPDNDRCLSNLATALHSSDLPGNRLVTLHYDPAGTPQSILAEHQSWAARHAASLAGELPPCDNDRDPERRLRIGYVSPYFHAHVVGRNLHPVLAHHDRRQFEIFCYADVLIEDDLTRQMAAHADHWLRTFNCPDAELARRIRADRIDVLVDAAQHLPGNRLLVFARRPAPVQISHMGYPATTGLPAIDYRVTDPFLDPPGESEAGSTEQLLRLPHSFWCYQPPADSPDVTELPALRSGRVTFGSLNNLAKINPFTIDLWRQVLDAVPGSRLAVLVPAGRHANVLREFPAHGIPADRLELLPQLALAQYLAHYHRIDIGLDTCPYNGHNTGLDSFWMGVPVLTLPGQTSVSRAGVSILRNLGLPELIAPSPQDFVRLAIALAADLSRLREMRLALRDRMRVSPLMDAPMYTGDLEELYRKAWRRWCAP